MGKSIEKNKKKKEATSFAAKRMIDQVDLGQLKKKEFQKGGSNLGLVLDDYLKERIKGE